MSASTGNKIKKIREFRNLGQKYIADKLGISQANYSKIESGQVSLDTDRLEEIADILEVPVEAILGDSLQIFNNNSGTHSYYAGHTLNIGEESVIKQLQDLISQLKQENERLLKQTANKSIK